MSWEKVKLGNIADFSNGINFDKSAYGNGVKLIGVSNFGNRFYPDYDELSEIKEEVVRQGDYLQDGDIVFVRSNGNKELVGRCMLIHNPPVPVTFSGFSIKARLINTTLYYPKFFAYHFKSMMFRRAMSGTAVGANIQNLSQARLSNYEALIPDYDTQVRIAEILATYDNLIENNQKQIKLLEEMAQRLYKEWFVDLHFPGYEDVPVVDSVPKGWRKLSLSEIADVVMGQSPKSEFYNDNHEGLPFHQGVGTYGRRFVVDSTYSSSLAKIAEAGSILFSVRAPVGRLNFTKNKIVIGRGLAGMKEKDGHQSFLFYMLKERFFKDDLVGNGSIFASISKNELLDQMFVVPTDGLKCLFDNYVHSIDEKINALDSQITRLTEARDRLLPKLMSGEIKI